MSEQDNTTIHRMMRYGGSFVRALGEAAMRADRANLARIKESWPEFWIRYSPDRTFPPEDQTANHH